MRLLLRLRILRDFVRVLEVRSVSLCLSLFHSVSLCACVRLPLSVFQYVSVSLFVSACLCLSLSLSLPVCLCLSLCVCLCLTLRLCPSVSVSLSLTHCLRSCLIPIRCNSFYVYSKCGFRLVCSLQSERRSTRERLANCEPASRMQV